MPRATNSWLYINCLIYALANTSSCARQKSLKSPPNIEWKFMSLISCIVNSISRIIFRRCQEMNFPLEELEWARPRLHLHD